MPGEKERDTNWGALHIRQMTREMEGAETFIFFDEFRNGTWNFQKLNWYAKILFLRCCNILKQNEKPIIADYFDIEEDMYIGIPLLGTGKFQGIVWIVFKKEEGYRFEDIQLIKRLIKLFALEYNNLIMSWGLVKSNCYSGMQ